MTAVSAQLDFIKPLDIYTKEKPYQLFLAKPKSRQDVDLTNVEVDTVPNIPLHDVRGREDDFRLDEHGFQYIKHDQTFRAFDDPQRVNDEFLPQVVKVIKDHIPCAERVHVYDWRTRRESGADDTELVSPTQIEQKGFLLAPSGTVHTDSTEFTLLKRVRQFFPDEADRLLEGRVRMINFWRPMHHAVQNWPLVTCDSKTLRMDKLTAVDQVYRRFVGDVYYARYDPSYQWYYQSLMGPDEAVLFKSWDTAKDASVRTCIHSSTPLPEETLPKHYEPRMSIECRALVFSKK